MSMEGQQRSESWRAARRGKLTASNLGALLGLVNYTSRIEAFRRAQGTDTFEGNDATRWGTDNEANAILDYQTLTGNVVNATGLHVHPTIPWIAGSPDGLVGATGMVEAKCPYYYKKGGGRLHKEIPAHYYLQMNALLEICDREWCDFISWCPEGSVVYRVTRDTAAFDYLLSYYGQIYAAMEANMSAPPPLSHSQKSDITFCIERSMRTHINYKVWANADPSFPPPSPEPEDEDEPPLKRPRGVF